ncbi:MAG: helix-turn-helix domain-containing protein [Chloroflexota bacterium]
MSGALDILATFATDVTGAAARAGLSQEDLAERAGLHRTYTTGMERGQRNMTLVGVARLAPACSLRYDELIDEGRK